MSDEQYNCGKHTEKRGIPHWHGKKWCNGFKTQEKKK